MWQSISARLKKWLPILKPALKKPTEMIDELQSVKFKQASIGFHYVPFDVGEMQTVINTYLSNPIATREHPFQMCFMTIRTRRNQGNEFGQQRHRGDRERNLYVPWSSVRDEIDMVRQKVSLLSIPSNAKHIGTYLWLHHGLRRFQFVFQDRKPNDTIDLALVDTTTKNYWSSVFCQHKHQHCESNIQAIVTKIDMLLQNTSQKTKVWSDGLSHVKITIRQTTKQYLPK